MEMDLPLIFGIIPEKYNFQNFSGNIFSNLYPFTSISSLSYAEWSLNPIKEPSGSIKNKIYAFLIFIGFEAYPHKGIDII
jgi:hypothetical protein